jgi:hypothetical protein
MHDITMLFDSVTEKTVINPLGFTTALDRKFSMISVPYLNKRLWGSNYYMWNGLESESLKFDTLTSVTPSDNSSYFYVIPCSTHADIGDPFLLMTLPVELLEKIANSNINILYDYTIEIVDLNGQIAASISDVYSYLKSINEHYNGKIVVSTANTQFRMPFHPGVRYVTLPGWVKYIQYELAAQHGPHVDEYLAGTKSSLFLCLNRINRFNRHLFLHGLLVNDLFNDGLVSNLSDYPKLDKYATKTLLNRANNNLDFLPVMVSLMNNLVPVMTLDVSRDSQNLNSKYEQSWITDVCFDVITETTLQIQLTNNNSPVLSEKTFKSIFFGKPFMIVGDSGSLKRLHELGFKTFPFLFNESYDLVDDVLTRQSIIIQNILRWKGKETEFMEVMKEHREVIDHNMRLVNDFPASAIYTQILNEALQ